MKKTRSDRELADDIVRKLSEDTPENAAMEAQSLLQCARDAGGGALRAEYVAKAQRALARLNPAHHPDLIQNLQAQLLALQGRRGDTKIAHVTPGEIVIPKRLQTPELMNALATAARENGVEPGALRIGSGRNSINPHTGQPEFADSIPVPPQGPEGASIDQNMQEAAKHSPNLLWFYNQVRNKGPWDYKQKGADYQDFGNFHYGAVGSALGVPEQVLRRAAGWAQRQAGTSKPEWGSPLGSWPYGDDPADQAKIGEGMLYKKSKDGK